jgi:bifunctional UDP-N-acetylglucosamine pyrophosphorylase / glucosamine-1-phosphate N-acetyltransferase
MKEKTFPESAPLQPRFDLSLPPTASVVLAAGKGSRMTGCDGCKPLLPLIPADTPFEGCQPILLQILANLPAGPVALVVHHKKNLIIQATSEFSPTYCEQPVLNGTGGALLAARDFIASNAECRIIITMGDVPLVSRDTYTTLVRSLDDIHMAVLAFAPCDKKRYGLLEVKGKRVQRIVEWEYWRHYPLPQKENLRLCNSGIYGVRGNTLLHYLPIMESQPHKVVKQRGNKEVIVEEFFITDLVEYLNRDGLTVGCIEAGDEDEVMGVDDPCALEKAQELYKARFAQSS